MPPSALLWQNYVALGRARAGLLGADFDPKNSENARIVSALNSMKTGIHGYATYAILQSMRSVSVYKPSISVYEP